MNVIVNNIAVEYHDDGSGPVMLFLHGWQDDLHTFDAVTEMLKNKWRIIRLDLPGFGMSEAPKSAWSLGEYAEFVKNFAVKLNIAPDILVGHSFGGRIAIKAVGVKMLFPRKVILIASAGIAKTSTPRNIFFAAIAKIGKIITLVPPFYFWREQFRKKLYTWTGSDYLEAGPLMQEIFLKIIREDIGVAAQQIAIPALLIWGQQDTETPLSDAKRLMELIQGSKLEIIPGAGHFIHRQYPDRIAGLIRNFASL